MKLYIYVFLSIFLLFIITFNVLNTYHEGYASSYSGPSGLYSTADTSNTIYNRTGKNQQDRLQAVSDISTPPPAMAPSAMQYKTTYHGMDDLNVMYHDSPEDIQTQMGTDPSANLIMVLDNSGNLVQVPISQTANDTTYYEEANLRYDPSNFVPTYEDTIYFSKLTGLGYQKPIYGTDSQWGGFCTFNKDFPDNIEQKCMKLDGDTCASTSCCVLLGGKCVAGNENGPTKKSHYQEQNKNKKDKYFFMGKCYGNCVDDQSNYYNYNNEKLSEDNDQLHKLNLKTGIYDVSNGNVPWQNWVGNTQFPTPGVLPTPASQSIGSQCTLDKLGILRDNNNHIIASGVLLDSQNNFVDVNGNFVNCVNSPSPVIYSSPSPVIYSSPSPVIYSSPSPVIYSSPSPVI